MKTDQGVPRPLDLSSSMKTELCNFSGAKIYPGHGKIFVRGDSKSFRLLNGKCEAHFLTKKNPRKFNWTVFYRRLHKKGAAEEVVKKRTRKTTKFQRAIVGASWEQIAAKRDQPSAVRKAARDAASEAAKSSKKTDEQKKKVEKIKNVSAGQRAQPKFKAQKSNVSMKPNATSR